MTSRVFDALNHGHCWTCDDVIEPGDEVCFNAPGNVVHVECDPDGGNDHD